MIHFNPIIVLFLTSSGKYWLSVNTTFQSYYSLISNTWLGILTWNSDYFNPIIVLFLTLFPDIYLLTQDIHFNPIIVLFLTILLRNKSKLSLHFNPIIVLFLTGTETILLIYLYPHFNPIIVLFLTLMHQSLLRWFVSFQSYYSLISNSGQLLLSAHYLYISILL